MEAASGSTTLKWEPISPTERRVLGVLVEKAKTTPEQYPLTANSLRTGCNQKNNRDPAMSLTEDQVGDALEHLRALGAVTEIHDSGRALKYRHRMYEWLGVEKTELAVMAELLLRGPQTEGELRGRASRMEPIEDLGALRTLLDNLKRKGLIEYLTPAGRGAVVSHLLFKAREIEQVRHHFAGAVVRPETDEDEPALMARPAEGAPRPPSATPAPVTSSATAASPSRGEPSAAINAEVATLHRELAELRQEFAVMRDQLTTRLDDLCRQLGVN